jgi:hypothetical protein
MRRGMFAGLVVVCLAVLAVTVIAAVRGADSGGGASAGVDRALTAARSEHRPMVVMRTTDGSGVQKPGHVTLASLSSPSAASVAPLRCDRVYFAGGRGICLAPQKGFAAGYAVKIFDSSLRVHHEVEVTGIPSRARVSPDGRYGSVTLFVTGHSYAAAGTFSTQTTLIDLERGTKIADLENFTVTRDGRQVTAVDANFWGMTFAKNSDRFYATLATGGKTYLIEGSISERIAHVIHENVECPSLSPDGTRIAYKSRTGSSNRPWRLTVLDLSTMRETPLAERRSVDDQAEWLDDDHVLYAIDGETYEVDADGGGSPRRFAARAESPAVIRW